MLRNPISRIRFLSVLIFIFTSIVIVRLYSLQVVSGDLYANRADRQYMQSTYDYFDRGTIYFSSKDGDTVSGASLKTGFIVAMTPKLVLNPESTYEALATLLEIEKDDFLQKASKKDDPYEEIAKRVPSAVAEKIDELKLPGVRVFRERWRFYPGNSLAAHALGFIAYNENELRGQYGLERYYEETLRRNNDSVYVNFFAEIFSNIQDGLSGDKNLEGDIVTTIEPSVQVFLEQQLASLSTNWNADYSGGIIMDPSNGEIVALGLYPAFDPNNLKNETSANIFQNHLVESVYEMGSIIKPLTVAAGIDAGAITPNSTYFDAGSMTLNGRTFSNFDGKARGIVSMQEVLNQSLNTGVAHIVKEMGKNNFAEYMKSFGLGKETGIDLPNETHGLIENLSSPRDIEYATASFGQGIALTPIETVRALAVLGNGGKLVNPHLVKRVNYRIGGYKEIKPGVDVQVLKPETSEDISRMLVGVVDTALLNGKVKMERYSIAAKTGTAQIPRENGRGYYEDRYLHSFFGYFPAYEPKFIVFLYSFDPKGVRYASETLTYPFMDITKFLINYYQIPPDR